MTLKSGKSYIPPLPWVLIMVTALVVYFPALGTFFSQDDFTHLRLSRAENPLDFLRFFIPLKSGIFYRPLSVQLYTWISRSLFRLNPFGFHLVAMGFHLANIYLVYRILRRFIKRKKLVLMGAFFYGAHPVHFMSLFWIAEFSMVLAPFFAFLAINDFFDKRYYRFWLWMVLGLLSNELVAAVPLILGSYLIIKKRTFDLKWLVLPAVLVGAILLLRFVIFPTSLGTEYLVSSSPLTMIKNIRWHLIRAVGFPEGFRGQLKLPETFMAISFLTVTLTYLAGILVWQRRALLKLMKLIINTASRSRMLIFGGVWFLASLLPVIFLSRHQSPIYQIIGLPGFFLAVKEIFSIVTKRNQLILTGLWGIAAFWSVRAMEQYHWVTKRARLAEYHLEKVANHAPSPNQSIVFLNTTAKSSTEVYLSMGGENAIKVFFGDEIKVMFEDFSDNTQVHNGLYILSRKKIN